MGTGAVRWILSPALLDVGIEGGDAVDGGREILFPGSCTVMTLMLSVSGLRRAKSMSESTSNIDGPATTAAKKRVDVDRLNTVTTDRFSSATVFGNSMRLIRRFGPISSSTYANSYLILPTRNCDLKLFHGGNLMVFTLRKP